MDKITIASTAAADDTSDVTTQVAGDVDVLVTDELLVEEISIDGMCGVY